MRNKPDSILHILRAPLGGAFRHVIDLARGQAERGHPVGLICDAADYGTGSRDKLAALEAVCELGVQRLEIPRSPGIRDVRAVRAIRRRWKTDGPAILHGHGAKGAAYARIIAPMIGAAAVCTPHGGALHYSFGSLNGAVYLSLERALKHGTGGMIFESYYAKGQYVDKVGKITFPHRVIYNGLYEEEFVPVDTQNAPHDFLFIGEFRELKGVFTLLESVRRLYAAGHRFTLLMAGSGPDGERLRRCIEQWKLDSIVTVSGPIHPARTAFARARCLLAPSLNESMPYIVLEAIAARVPVITTGVGGIPEIYGTMRESLLPAGDVTALAAAMQAFLESPHTYQQTADVLHRYARSHITVTQMVSEILDFYRTVKPTP